MSSVRGTKNCFQSVATMNFVTRWPELTAVCALILVLWMLYVDGTYASERAGDTYSGIRRSLYRVFNIYSHVFLLILLAIVLIFIFVDFDEVLASSRLVLLAIFMLVEVVVSLVMVITLHSRKEEGQSQFAAVAFAVVSLVAFFIYGVAVSFTAFPDVFESFFSLKLRYFDAEAPLAKYGRVVENLVGCAVPP